MKTSWHKITAVVGVAALSACAPVTISPSGGEKLTTEPTVSERYQFMWWGLQGEGHFNAAEMCGGAPVLQMQTAYTPEDALLGFITLGILAPRHANVWCG